MEVASHQSIGEFSSPNGGTGARFSHAVVILAGIAALAATLVTILFV